MSTQTLEASQTIAANIDAIADMFGASKTKSDFVAIAELLNLPTDSTVKNLKTSIQAWIEANQPATEPTATEPTATEPTATEPTATEPTATEPTATENDPIVKAIYASFQTSLTIGMARMVYRKHIAGGSKKNPTIKTDYYVILTCEKDKDSKDGYWDMYQYDPKTGRSKSVCDFQLTSEGVDIISLKRDPLIVDEVINNIYSDSYFRNSDVDTLFLYAVALVSTLDSERGFSVRQGAKYKPATLADHRAALQGLKATFHWITDDHISEIKKFLRNTFTELKAL